MWVKKLANNRKIIFDNTKKEVSLFENNGDYSSFDDFGNFTIVKNGNKKTGNYDTTIYDSNKSNSSNENDEEKTNIKKENKKVVNLETTSNASGNAEAFGKSYTADTSSGIIKGNRRTKIYHLPGGASYNRISTKNVVYFNSEAEAKQAGYRPAKR